MTQDQIDTNYDIEDVKVAILFQVTGPVLMWCSGRWLVQDQVHQAEQILESLGGSQTTPQ